MGVSLEDGHLDHEFVIFKKSGSYFKARSRNVNSASIVGYVDSQGLESLPET